MNLTLEMRFEPRITRIIRVIRGSFLLSACASGSRLSIDEDLFERSHELRHFFSGSDGHTEVLRHRRKRASDRNVLLCEILNNSLDVALHVNHEEIRIRGDAFVSECLKVGHSLVANLSVQALDLF